MYEVLNTTFNLIVTVSTGIANAVTIIRAADDDNANGNDDSGSQRSRNESLSDFAGKTNVV